LQSGTQAGSAAKDQDGSSDPGLTWGGVRNATGVGHAHRDQPRSGHPDGIKGGGLQLRGELLAGGLDDDPRPGRIHPRHQVTRGGWRRNEGRGRAENTPARPSARISVTSKTMRPPFHSQLLERGRVPGACCRTAMVVVFAVPDGAVLGARFYVVVQTRGCL
jgi:hypothetical protein